LRPQWWHTTEEITVFNCQNHVATIAALRDANQELRLSVCGSMEQARTMAAAIAQQENDIDTLLAERGVLVAAKDAAVAAAIAGVDAALAYRAEVEKRDDTIAAKDAHLAIREETIASLNRQIAAYKEALRRHRESIANADTTCSQQRDIIGGLRQSLEEQMGYVKNYRKVAKEYSDEVDKMRDQVAACGIAVEAAQAEATEKQRIIETLGEALQEAEAELLEVSKKYDLAVRLLAVKFSDYARQLEGCYKEPHAGDFVAK
jgi:chromosome segregation ATPase